MAMLNNQRADDIKMCVSIFQNIFGGGYQRNVVTVANK
jgi:hypothetical protein